MGSSKPTFPEKTHLGSFSLNMKVFLLSVAFSVTIISAGPMPQDPNDDAEVFSGPIDSNAGDPDYDYFGSIFPRPRVRVIVVPIAPDYSDSDNYDYPLPTFGHSPPSFNPLFHLLRTFFGPPVSSNTTEVEADRNKNESCFLCSIFRDSFNSFQDHIDSVKDKENEIDFDVNNSTHTTKVLDDGTIVHINKTTVSDTDEDGNSFFFHRAVIHNIGAPEDEVNENQNKDNYDPELSLDEDDIDDTGVDSGLI